MNFSPAGTPEALRKRRELAESILEVQLCDTAYRYEVAGCGLEECNGLYTYGTSASHGAPIYQNEAGWTLHRDRPPVIETWGTDNVSTECSPQCTRVVDIIRDFALARALKTAANFGAMAPNHLRPVLFRAGTSNQCALKR